MPFNDRLIVLLKVCPFSQRSILTGAQTRMEKKEYSNFSITIPEAK